MENVPPSEQLRQLREVLGTVARAIAPVQAAIQEIGRTSAHRLTPITEQLRELGALFAPGTPAGDFWCLQDATQQDDARLEAARRLAGSLFTRRYVFHPNRWALLEDAFTQWRGDRGYAAAWCDLATPVLFIAAGELDDQLTIAESWQLLRNALRNGIELELIGRTLRQQDPTPPMPAEIFEMAEYRIEDLVMARVILDTLSESDLNLLLAYEFADDREALAAEYGISYANLRQRVSRIRRKIPS